MRYVVVLSFVLLGCSSPELPECNDSMVKINKMEPTQYSWCKGIK